VGAEEELLESFAGEPSVCAPLSAGAVTAGESPLVEPSEGAESASAVEGHARVINIAVRLTKLRFRAWLTLCIASPSLSPLWVNVISKINFIKPVSWRKKSSVGEPSFLREQSVYDLTN
jgi:hypothetical protein